MSLTPEQCRAARALLDWSQPDLAEASGLTRQTIARFERGARTPHPTNRDTLRAALEAGGVEFLDETPTKGPGVRLRK
jgi:transcriptional regulator with XRE-family HTH domain